MLSTAYYVIPDTHVHMNSIGVRVHRKLCISYSYSVHTQLYTLPCEVEQSKTHTHTHYSNRTQEGTKSK